MQTYTQASAWHPPEATRSLFEQVAQAGTAGGAALVPDPALSVVADELARRVALDPEGRPPAAGIIQGLSWLAGVSDPIPSVVSLRGDLDRLSAQLPNEIADIARTDHPSHFGVGRATLHGRSALVVALTERRLRLDAVPRRVAVGDRVRVRGALLGALRSPQLAITHPDGHTEETPMGDGPEFFSQFPAAARGVYQVEITAESDVGSTVVANFPVYVDTDPPATPEATTSVQSEAPEAVEATLLRLINETRVRNHLAPLQTTEGIAGVARAHSRDMADNRFVAHVSPTHGNPSDRLREGGLLSGLVLENVARGYSAAEIHEGLMASPGHRANVLNPRVTHVGIGAVRESLPGGGLLITQDFIEVAAAIDTASAPARLLASINAVRATRGAAPLTAAPQLSAVAGEAAASYFQDARRTQQEVLNAATARVSRESLLYRRVSLAAAVGGRIEELDRLEPLLERQMNAIGIGVAQGDRPDAPPRSLFVVYVLAVTR